MHKMLLTSFNYNLHAKADIGSKVLDNPIDISMECEGFSCNLNKGEYENSLHSLILGASKNFFAAILQVTRSLKFYDNPDSYYI